MSDHVIEIGTAGDKNAYVGGGRGARRRAIAKAANPANQANGAHAFREHASGLIVPTELSRDRIVFPDDESRTINRAITFLNRRGIDVYFACTNKRCETAGPLEPRRTPGGDFVLQCEHADYTFTRAF